MTDKELAMLLTESLDNRIARAEAAPVTRVDENRMPPAEAVSGSLIRAVPARQLRWKGVAAAVLVVAMLGGIGLTASKLIDRKSPSLPADSGQVEETQTDPEKTAQVTEPIDPTALPQVSYDADKRTIRISGTTGYDRLDLNPYLDDARYLEVEDDRFQFSNSIAALRNMFDDLAVDLPDYLNRMDRSFDLIADYIVSVAPNEEIAAQTRKPIQILMRNGTYRVSDDHISLYMGERYRRYGILYAGALLNPKRESWYETGYTNWIGFCVDPYNYVNVGFSLDECRDYYYIRDYFRLGGTEDPLDLNNQALVFDACAWYNLVHGRDWGGNTSECCPIKEWYGFNGDPELEGNDLCGQEAVSLINYLANQYGEKQVAAFCFETCSFEEAFGTDFATARAAWEQSLMDRFGDGSETDPTDPAALPQVSYDTDKRTIRISGTAGYDRLDLSPYLEGASFIEVEDDRFQFSASVYILRDMDEIDDLAADLPRCLDRMDRSLDYIANYIAAVAPNEEIAAQTRKPVKITMPRIVNYHNYDEYIALDLGQDSFYRLSLLYADALLNPRYFNWYSMGYYFWINYCQDPYSFQLLHFFPGENSDYFYHQDYIRVGGTEESTPDNMKLLLDANAWYNLVHGHDWDGLEGECSPIKELPAFDGDPELEGNDLCMTEAISLINYLAEQYGHDKVAAFCFETCSFEEAFGTDFATARAAWEQSLMDRFGDGSENP